MSVIDCIGRKSHSLERGLKNKAEYNANPNICLHCQAPILASRTDVLTRVKDKKYCSKSCFAKRNNKTSPPKKEHFCKRCGCWISSKWTARTNCDECYYTLRNAGKQKISDSTHSKIRSHARHTIKDREQVCANCRYNKFVETCHIKPIQSFSKDTLISIVNDPENLILLCPNCHWELDHNMITIDQIMGNKNDR
jgi:hypothetical protein